MDNAVYKYELIHYRISWFNRLEVQREVNPQLWIL